MLTVFRIDTLVVDPWCTDLDRTRGGGHGAGGVKAVTDHQSMPVLVEPISESSDIRGYFGLQRRRQHRPHTLAHNLVNRRTRLGVVVGAGTTVDYFEHSGHTFHPALARQG